ncbi:hypothetical protein GX618_02785 [Candidatus Dojkabacteria bacterium]|uniref:Uncharacterized protein n=1 Tax=Candidatus Dojkabacteria bacterium TaxID=2099670 RepID=A0A847ETV2_9BACT|nr:hypothetical protein [Candidatus Dojkabacteria bacterium]
MPNTTLVSNGEAETPFKTSENASLGTHEGWIVDPDNAQEVANLEDVARNAEKRLQKEHETGMSEKERENIKILEVLVEEFPYAFKESTDEQTGEKYYLTGISALPYSDKQTESEVIRLNREFFRLRDFSMMGLLDQDNRFRGESAQPCISKVGIQLEGRKKESISFQELIPERQELLLQILSFLNDRGEVINKHLEEEKAKVTPEGLRERIRAMKNNGSEN